MKTKLTTITFIISIFCCSEEPKVKIDYEKRTRIETDTLTTTNYKIGVAAMLSPKEALPAYEEIVKYIGNKMELDIDMIFTKDYAAMNELVKDNKVMAAFVCSGPYVKAHDEWEMELLVAPSLHGNAYYYSYIIVNKKSAINKLEDLEQKKFAFTDPESNTGKLVPTYELLKMGKNIENFFGKIIYTGSHDKSIEAVANNLVDGASVDHLIWEFINNYDSSITSKTRIIAKLGPYCSPPVVVNPNCDIEIKNKIKNILLEMHRDKKGKVILDKLLIDKFVLVEDDCYKSVREMQKCINEQQN